MKRLAAFSAICVATFALAGQVRALFTTPDGSVALYGAGEINASGLQPSIDFNLKGSPFKVESRQQGMTLRGDAGDGRVTSYDIPDAATKKTKRAYFVEKTNVVGHAQVVVDSDIADKFLQETTKKPSTAKGQTRTQIDSTLFNYAGTAELGNLDLPEPAVVQSESKGRHQVKKKKDGKDVQVWESFDQTLNLRGTKGQISLNPTAKGNEVALKKGFLDGPVTFKIHRIATEDGGIAPTVDDVDGVCDRIEMDLTATPKTIRMIGHLKMTTEGTGRVFAGMFEADEATFTLSDSLQITGMSATGSPGKPTVTTIPLKKGGR